MFTLCDGRVMFLAPDVAAKISMAEIQPRQEFWLCKRRPARKGEKLQWSLYLEDPSRLPNESGLEHDLRVSINQAQRAAAPVEQAAPKPSPETAPPAPQVTLGTSQVIAARF